MPRGARKRRDREIDHRYVQQREECCTGGENKRAGGGCFFAHAYHEYDSQPGPVRDQLANQKQRWTTTIVAHIRSAQKRGQLRADTDPEQLAFELDAVGVLVNSLWQLNRDPSAFDLTEQRPPSTAA